MKMTKKVLGTILILAGLGFIGIRLNAANDAETARQNMGKGMVVTPIGLANMIKNANSEAARRNMTSTMLASISAAGGQAQQETMLAHLAATVMVVAMNTKNSTYRDSVMKGLADVAEQLGNAIVDARRLSGEDADDVRERMFAIVAAALSLNPPVPKAGTTDEIKENTINAFVDQVPEAFAEQTTAVVKEPATILGNELAWATRETIQLVQEVVFSNMVEDGIVDILDPSGASTTTTTTTTTSTTRPSPTPVGLR